jgi:pimeloyl-ACP methyl ester carboxylesterase
VPQVRANGIDIEYESFGRVGDPLILLIMGFAAQLIFWPEALCQGLAVKGFRVVRFDNRDIGKSTHLPGLPAPDPRALMTEVMAGNPPDVPYTLDDMAEDAIGLMDALGVERAHIVGASMGGMIAQLAAINHPNRTKSLVSIMSTTGRRGLPPGNRETLSVLFRPPES